MASAIRPISAQSNKDWSGKYVSVPRLTTNLTIKQNYHYPKTWVLCDSLLLCGYYNVDKNNDVSETYCKCNFVEMVYVTHAVRKP